jgi:4-azaleucine resistance transporter AzlC
MNLNKKRRQNSFKKALEVTFPILFAYGPLGMVFGLLCVHQGYDWYLAVLMSAFVFAGAVQFLVLTMLDNGAMLFSILLAAFFIGFRNLFYGLSFLDRFKKLNPLLKSILAFGMVDATYAILLSRPKASLRFCLQVTALNYIYWVGGTLIGALFADFIPEMHGLDFILTAFFMILVLDFYLVNRTVEPIFLPIVFAALSYIILPSYYLILAICFSLIFLSFKHVIASRQGKNI